MLQFMLSIGITYYRTKLRHTIIVYSDIQRRKEQPYANHFIVVLEMTYLRDINIERLE
jgi:hypothetical protein